MAKKNYYEEVIEKGVGLPYGIDREDIKKAQEFNFIRYWRENYSSVLLEGWKDILNEAKSFRSDIHDALSPFEQLEENLVAVVYGSLAIPVYSLYLIPAEIVNIVTTFAKYPKKKKRKKELLNMISYL